MSCLSFPFSGFLAIVSIVNLTLTKVTLLKGLRAIRPVRIVARFSSMKIILKVSAKLGSFSIGLAALDVVALGPNRSLARCLTVSVYCLCYFEVSPSANRC
jgi:hypothetical protein